MPSPSSMGSTSTSAANGDSREFMRPLTSRISQVLHTCCAVTGTMLLTTHAAFPQVSVDRERAELAEAVSAATETLQAGLSAASKYGQPISARFEIGFEEVHLSVYVTNKGTLSELLVDRTTGTTSTPDSIEDPQDLVNARAQSAAMAKAKRSLSDAVGRALASHPGFHALSAIPALKGGHPVAEVALVKGRDGKSVSERLD